ncbi:MAG: pyridoxal-phosphate dependent enzyme, partial [Anaerolineae bacterium]
MQVTCPACGACETLSADRWRCDCGAAWEPVARHDLDPGAIDADDRSLWRYRRLLDLGLDQPTVRLGAGWTPLVPLAWAGRTIHCKLEFLAPTASFKDRGTATMIEVLARLGVRRVVDDSSGNAGASVAAYAAAAGLHADIYVPAYASPAKQQQIAVYGARVHATAGPRDRAREAAFAAVSRSSDVALASHAYHPAFLAGQQTVAWELWEQMGRQAPGWLVLPVGQGLHLLGAWHGFRRLAAAGLVERIPRLVAVQAARLAPLVRAFNAGLDDVPALEPEEPSVAEGLAIARPVRGRRLLAAIRESGGACLAVDDEAILSAQRQLAHCGFYVEPTSATAVAALDEVFRLASPGDE